MARQRALHGGSDGGACAGGQPRRAMLHTPCAAQTDLINASALPLNIWWVPPASLSMSPNANAGDKSHAGTEAQSEAERSAALFQSETGCGSAVSIHGVGVAP